MRQLVPHFILDQYALGVHSGRFQAVCMFVDTSGFTPLTTALMAHGQEGAEAVASTLTSIYRPLVRTVYRYGGFIGGFAGDAFKAIFTLDQAGAYERTAAAAVQIHRHMSANRFVETRFGRFPFQIKIILADGNVDWGIWHGEGADQQAVCFFEGEGLSRCLDADPHTRPDEITVTRTVGDRISAPRWHFEPVRAGLLRLVHGGTAATPEPVAPSPTLTALQSEAAGAFFPENLLNTVHQGEFRRVVTVFINLPRLPEEIATGPAAHAFSTTLFRLLSQTGGYLCRIGRIGDRDKGVTILLFWGAPTSREQDLDRALSFLVHLKAGIEIPFSAGVTSGMAYAGFIGAAEREEYTCYGGSVNLAARIMVTARPGEIWLDEAAAHAAADRFETQPLGRVPFKGYEEGLPAFLLTGASGMETVKSYEGGLIGRSEELAALLDAVNPVFSGKFAGIAIITGEAGIGKSRLVHELAVSLQRRASGVQIAVCRADEVMRTPLHPVRKWLLQFFDQQLRPAEQNLAALRAIFAGLTASLADQPDGPEARPDLERARIFLEALLGFVEADSPYTRLDASARLENIIDSLKAFIKACSLRAPFVLHLEDAHWADEDTLRFLEALTRNIADYPIAVVITRRKEAGLEELTLNTEAKITRIKLKPFDRPQLAALCRRMMPGEPQPALLDLLAERTDGNPFFSEQILFYLRDHGGLAQSEGGFAPETGEGVLPDDVRAVLVARIDRLQHKVRETVQTAAVLGRSFEVTILGKMMEQGSELEQSIHSAEDARIWAALNELSYLFRHALLRDAAYEMQLRSVRRKLHRLAGEAYEQVYSSNLAPQYGLLAYHFRSAEMPEKAAAYLEMASEEAEAGFQPASALYYYRQLIDLTADQLSMNPQDESLRTKMIGYLLKAGQIANSTGSLVDGAQFFDRAIEYCLQVGDRENEVNARVDRGWSILWNGSYLEARKYFQTLLEALDPDRDALNYNKTLTGIAGSNMYLGKLEEAEEGYLQALDAAARLNDDHMVSTILGNLGLVCWKQQRYELALENYEKARAIDQTLGNQTGVLRHTGNIGIIQMELGRYADALETIGQALLPAEEMGHKRAVAMRTGNMGIVYGLIGEFDKAYRNFERALQLDREGGYTLGEGLWYGNIGEILNREERFSEAVEQFELGEAVLRRINADYNLPWLLNGKTEALLGAGDFERAAAVQAEALRIADKVGRQDKVFEARLFGARITHAQGHLQQGISMLEDLLAGAVTEEDRALVHYELWRMGAGAPHREEALLRYETVAVRDPQVKNRRRLAELRLGSPLDR